MDAKVVKVDDHGDASRVLTFIFYVNCDYVLNAMIRFGNLDDYLYIYFFDNSIDGCNGGFRY